MVLSLLKRGFLFGFITLSFCAGARPVIITIDADSRSGTQIGTLIGEKVQNIFPDVQQRYDRYLAFLLSSAQFAQLVPQINVLKGGIDPDYQAEVDGIAAVWQLGLTDKLGDGNLSINEFWLLQLLPDLTAVNKGLAFATANRSETNPIAARNLDWESIPDLRSLQAINIYRYDKRTVVSLSFAGLAGVINGFNDQGLFVSLLDASEQRISTPSSAQNASSFELRTVLKEMNKIKPASRALAQKSYPRSLQILLADPQNIAVLEQAFGANGRLRKAGSTLVTEMPWSLDEQLAAVNCFVLKASPKNCYATTDHYRWGRLAQLLDSLRAQNLSVKDVITLMQDRLNTRQAIFNQDTLQSIVFTPKDRVLYLYSQAAIKKKELDPVYERYQLIETASDGVNEKLIDVAMLVLGIGILTIAWAYVFRGNKKARNAPVD